MAVKSKKTKKTPRKKKAASKFGAIKTEIDGITFDSKLESRFYSRLKEQKDNGTIKHFEIQPRYILQEKYIVVDGAVVTGSNPLFDKIKRKSKAKTILPIEYAGDFLITHNDGSQVVIDVKGGILTAEFRIKRKMYMMKYPELPLILMTHVEKYGGWIDYDTYEKAKRASKAEKAKSAATNTF
jgi:hypothetical protein